MKKIDSKQSTIEILLDGEHREFLIPSFQREYVWGKDEALQLMEDFSEDSNNFNADLKKLPGYLLGNIVLISQDNGETPIFQVVDGQQRMVTLTLLSKVLSGQLYKRSRAMEDEDPNARRFSSTSTSMESLYIESSSLSEEAKPRINFSKYLNYSRIYNDILLDEAIVKEPEVSSEFNIKEVYETLNEYVEELSDSQVYTLALYLLKTVQVIETVAPNENKAFQLFEVLNSRGKGLEPLDLIKNIFMQKIFEEGTNQVLSDEFNLNWKTFNKNLENVKGKSVSSSTFLKHFIIGMHGKNIKKDNLYGYFLNLNLSVADIKVLSQNLADCSKIYSDINNNIWDSYIKETSDYTQMTEKEMNEINKGLNVIFKIFGVWQFQSLLIPFYKSSKADKIKLINTAVQFGGSVMFAQRQTNVIENSLTKIMAKYWTRTEDRDFTYLIDSIDKEKFIYIDELPNMLRTFNFVNKKGRALMLLKFLDYYGNNVEQVINSPKSGRNSVTLEHISPVELSLDDKIKAGFVDALDYKNYLNLLGNLSLLRQSENSSVKNSIFEDKKAIFRDTDFIITSNIISLTENNYNSGQAFEAIEKINENNLSINEYVNDNDESITVKKHWTKEAIIIRGKLLETYTLGLLQD